VADGIIFEKLGVQTATIVTDSFTASGNAMARRMGMPGYRYAMLPHPISNLTPDECRIRAEAVLPEILEIVGLDPRQLVPAGASRSHAVEQLPWPPRRTA
jgi:hypothetical protein